MAFSFENFSSSEDGSDTKKDKRKRGSGFKLPLPVGDQPSAEKPKAEKPPVNIFEKKTLADLALGEKTAEKPKEIFDPKPPEAKAASFDIFKKESPEEATVVSAFAPQTIETVIRSSSPEAVEKPKVGEKIEKKEPANNPEETSEKTFKHTEIAPNDLPLGEGIIHLQGDTPLEERVIPLSAHEAETMRPEALVFNRQPEQQAQQGPREPEEPDAETLEPEADNGGEVPPNEPPENSPFSPDEPEEPESSQTTTTATNSARQTPQTPPRPTPTPNQPLPPQPNTYQSTPNTQYAYAQNIPTNPNYNVIPPVPTPPNPNVLPAPGASAPNLVATKQDVENAVYYAHRAGRRQGVLAGLIVGGGYEHFKHRRREKREQKRLKVEDRKRAQQQASQEFFTRQQSQELDSTKRSAEQAQVALQQAERRPNLPAPEQHALLTQGAERVSKTGETSERKFVSKLEKILPKRFEKKAPNTPEVPEQLEIPKEHHIETSAWHTIEVDSRTGKAVENPTFAYGHEYYHERAQEATPRDDNRNAAAGEVALVAAALSSSDQSQGVPPLASGQYRGGSSPSASTSKDASQNTASSKTKSALQNSGPLWPWIVAFVVVVVLIIAAL